MCQQGWTTKVRVRCLNFFLSMRGFYIASVFMVASSWVYISSSYNKCLINAFKGHMLEKELGGKCSQML